MAHLSAETIFYFILAIVLTIIRLCLNGSTKKNDALHYNKNKHTFQRQPQKNNSSYSQAKKQYTSSPNQMIEADDEKKQKIVAIVCPNCGAPLKVIYERCAYCGMSYKEAKDMIEKNDINEGLK